MKATITLLLLATSTLVTPTFAAAALPARSCFADLAETRSYTLGQPTHVLPAPDGHSVYYLRSAARDTTLHLYAYDATTKSERELARPDSSDEHLSTEEKARRERARMTLKGITDFAMSDDGAHMLATEGDTLKLISLPDGHVAALPGHGWIAPRLSPDGKLVAVVHDNDLHVLDTSSGNDTQLTRGASETSTRGLAEFAAAEELGRADGAWWSPDSTRLVYEEADTSKVETHYIADPGHPDRAPTSFRYPRAGTANATTKLGIMSRNGGATTWIAWDHDALPYVARVIWPKHGPLTLVLLDRAQKRQVVVAVDEATGSTRTLLEEHDDAWINLVPMFSPRIAALDLPKWLPDGSGFLWASEKSGTWQLELRHADGSLDHSVTPAGFRFDALDDVDPAGKDAIVTASPDRLSFGVYRIALAPGSTPEPVAAAPGRHDATFPPEGHASFTDSFSLADGTTGTNLLARDGTVLATLPSHADKPPRIPQVEYTTAGPRNLDAAIVRPSDFDPAKTYPVVLSVYAGPGVKNVLRAPYGEFEEQCLADQGPFIVVTFDGRGTPGRDHDFERATANNLIDAPLADQVEGLQALGTRYKQIDLKHAGVEGWSFGGYFTAMATIRRPDVFAAGAAGAPVVDFGDYDTAYTERYLGVPANAQDASGSDAGYKASNVLTYAPNLQRPLLIMHGLTDDNVYFENTMKLTQALLTAGKPYELVLLPGTHLLPEATIRARVDETRAAFLRRALSTR